jgi:hypothetical protein
MADILAAAIRRRDTPTLERAVSWAERSPGRRDPAVTLLLWSTVEIGEGWRDSRERLEMLEMHTGELEMRGELENAVSRVTCKYPGTSHLCISAYVQ